MKTEPIKTPEPPISWSQMVADLKDMGYNYGDLSRILGAGYYTFRNLYERRVNDPLWSTGEKLKRFHAQKMRQAKQRMKRKAKKKRTTRKK